MGALIIMIFRKHYSIAWQLAAIIMSAATLSGCQAPTREDFIKYPTLRKKWSMICDARSNAAEVNVEGCKNLHEWQAANQAPVLDNLMNQNMGK